MQTSLKILSHVYIRPSTFHSVSFTVLTRQGCYRRYASLQKGVDIDTKKTAEVKVEDLKKPPGTQQDFFLT
jgi:hypothetical protein